MERHGRRQHRRLPGPGVRQPGGRRPDRRRSVERQLARQVTRAPNATDATDVQALRTAGYDNRQILATTVYVALRGAFSTVNDALGALPDSALGRTAPPQVRKAVAFGRPVALDDRWPPALRVTDPVTRA
jgi:hypothetical protein